MKNFFKIIALAKNYKASLFLNVFFNVISILFGIFSFMMFLPFLEVLFSETGFQQILDKGAPTSALGVSMDSITEHGFYQMALYIQENGKMQMLLVLCGIILFMIFMKNIARYFALFAMTKVRNGIVRDYRNKIYAKILSLPLSYFSDERKGDIISKMTNDVKEIEWSVLRSIEAVYRDPISILFTVATLLFMSPKMTLFILFLIPVAALIGLIGKKLKKVSGDSQKKIGQMISTTEETLSGLRIIKAFNAEKKKEDQFVEENEHYTKQMTKLFRRIDLASPLSEFLGVGIIVGTMLYGGNLVFSGEIKGSELITFLGLFYTVIAPSKSLTDAVYNAQRGLASMERINEILDADNKIHDPETPQELKGLNDKIEFKNILFKYQQDNVLNEVNIEIPKGKSVALVGQSGSGKTTIANLLPRFYDIQEGEILIDGVNIKDVTQTNLRSLMGIVTQEAILFNDTVHNNIAFGNDKATREEVIAAAKIANAHEFVEGLEKGYDTNIGDGGGKLSGGQKQRLSIARAVLKNPDILILDEATSALDTESEKLVQDALNKLMKNRTSLIIAHRLSTIQHVDEIIVMQQGVIIERGSHQELLAKNGAYTKLIEMQSFN